jgi:uncharacterized protein YbaR (Trm112 family)
MNDYAIKTALNSLKNKIEVIDEKINYLLSFFEKLEISSTTQIQNNTTPKEQQEILVINCPKCDNLLDIYVNSQTDLIHEVITCSECKKEIPIQDILPEYTIKWIKQCQQKNK